MSHLNKNNYFILTCFSVVKCSQHDELMCYEYDGISVCIIDNNTRHACFEEIFRMEELIGTTV